MGLLGLTAVATLVSGLQVWLSSQPAWVWFKASLTGFAMALVLAIIMLGKEFHWWNLDGEWLDGLGLVWTVATLVVMAVVWWQAR